MRQLFFFINDSPLETGPNWIGFFRSNLWPGFFRRVSNLSSLNAPEVFSCNLSYIRASVPFRILRKARTPPRLLLSERPVRRSVFHSPGALFRLLPRPVTGQLPRLSIGPANQLFLVCKAIFAQVTIPCLKGGIGMSTVRRKDKRIGVTYVYEQEKGVWDPQKKQMRSKRTLIGKTDPETWEVVPTKG